MHDLFLGRAYRPDYQIFLSPPALKRNKCVIGVGKVIPDKYECAVATQYKRLLEHKNGVGMVVRVCPVVDGQFHVIFGHERQQGFALLCVVDECSDSYGGVIGLGRVTCVKSVHSILQKFVLVLQKLQIAAWIAGHNCRTQWLIPLAFILPSAKNLEARREEQGETKQRAV